MNSIYKTGNTKLDKLIMFAVDKDPLKANKLHRVLEETQTIEKGKPRIQVSDKAYRTYSDGTLFASLTEMNRWDYLLKTQLEGLIKDLRRQVAYPLQEGFIHRQWGEVQPLTYVADFAYINISFHRGIGERLCVEDSKGGYLTDIYKIKRKLFLHRYGEIFFFEV